VHEPSGPIWDACLEAILGGPWGRISPVLVNEQRRLNTPASSRPRRAARGNLRASGIATVTGRNVANHPNAGNAGVALGRRMRGCDQTCSQIAQTASIPGGLDRAKRREARARSAPNDGAFRPGRFWLTESCGDQLAAQRLPVTWDTFEGAGASVVELEIRTDDEILDSARKRAPRLVRGESTDSCSDVARRYRRRRRLAVRPSAQC